LHVDEKPCVSLILEFLYWSLPYIFKDLCVCMLRRNPAFHWSWSFYIDRCLIFCMTSAFSCWGETLRFIDPGVFILIIALYFTWPLRFHVEEKPCVFLWIDPGSFRTILAYIFIDLCVLLTEEKPCVFTWIDPGSFRMIWERMFLMISVRKPAFSDGWYLSFYNGMCAYFFLWSLRENLRFSYGWSLSFYNGLCAYIFNDLCQKTYVFHMDDLWVFIMVCARIFLMTFARKPALSDGWSLSFIMVCALLFLWTLS